jgi:HAD superfamily hydrolase (TIGR01509 family)
MNFRVVLFDIGGVLVEFTGTRALLGWTANRFTGEELGKFWLSSSTVRAFETGKTGPDEFAANLISELRLPVTVVDFLADFSSWPKALLPGATELVCRVKTSCLCATLSNTNAVHWPRLTKDMGLGGLFEHHFPSHLTGKIKPDHEAFYEVTHAFSCKPSEVLFLDDNLINVEAAKTVGFQAAAVRGAAEAEVALSQFGILKKSNSHKSGHKQY